MEEVDERVKVALEKLKSRKAEGRAKKVIRHVGQGALGFGLGTGLGYAGMRGIDALSKRLRGRPISPGSVGAALPLASGAFVASFPVWKALERERLRRDMEGD